MIVLPLKIYTRRKIFRYYTGLSFFIFVWISRLDKDENRLMRHETIHFWQQVELLFIFHWLLYVSFYVVARAKGHSHWVAYRYNPFEIEAFDNDHDEQYLKERKVFAWRTCVSKFQKSISAKSDELAPKGKFYG